MFKQLSLALVRAVFQDCETPFHNCFFLCGHHRSLRHQV